MLSPLTSSAQDDTSVFGQSKQSESALIGIRYNLKQTPNRQPSGQNPNTYFDVISEFLNIGRGEGVLNSSYRPLYVINMA
jgi:hypothetical protein